MKKYILMLSAILAFSGCNGDGSTVQDCKKAGYSGVVVVNERQTPILRCSDGEIVDGNLKANGSLFPISKFGNTVTYSFLSFNEISNEISKPSPQNTLRLDTINMLQDAAKTCNKAKVTLITGTNELTEQKAVEIIKECSLFKLDAELQK